MLSQHSCTPNTDVPIKRQDQAEPSTSHVPITMPLPAAHEVIKNKWVMVSSIHTFAFAYAT